MNQNTRVDSVERALQLLRSEQWTGPDGNPKIEEALMRIASTNKTPDRAVARKTLYLAVGAAFLLGAAGASGARAIYDYYTIGWHSSDGSDFAADVRLENGQMITRDGRSVVFHAQEDAAPKEAGAHKLPDGATFTTKGESAPAPAPDATPK